MHPVTHLAYQPRDIERQTLCGLEANLECEWVWASCYEVSLRDEKAGLLAQTNWCSECIALEPMYILDTTELDTTAMSDRDVRVGDVMTNSDGEKMRCTATTSYANKFDDGITTQGTWTALDT